MVEWRTFWPKMPKPKAILLYIRTIIGLLDLARQYGMVEDFEILQWIVVISNYEFPIHSTPFQKAFWGGSRKVTNIRAECY